VYHVRKLTITTAVRNVKKVSVSDQPRGRKELPVETGEFWVKFGDLS